MVDVEKAEEARAGAVSDLLQAIEGAIARLKAEAKERSGLATTLSKVAKAKLLSHPKRLEKAWAKISPKIDPDAARRADLHDLLAEIQDHIRLAPARIRQELGRTLKQTCETEGLELRVVSREDPVELRIPPLSIVLDFQKGQADLRFARDSLATSPLQADAILKAYRKTVADLDAPFDPDAFFDLCRQAYLRCIQLDGQPDGHRVELVRFLPELALLLQPRRFRENPTRRNFKPYPKGRFAWDVLRLRRANRLVRDGLRINFGVATGTTASQKGRVLYMEDAHGAGEYKLTVFFTKAES